MIVALEGLPGAGKTTTARLAAEALGGTYIHERSAEHPFLTDFYRDIERYTLETELCFVLIHYHQYRDLDSDQLVVLDYSPVKDLVFADLNLTDADHELFEAVYARTSGSIAIPDVAIFLDLDVEHIVQRVHDRGRDYERDIDPAYLTGLRDAYEQRQAQLGARVERLSVSPTMTREEVAAGVARLVSHCRDAPSQLGLRTTLDSAETQTPSRTTNPHPALESSLDGKLALLLECGNTQT